MLLLFNSDNYCTPLLGNKMITLLVVLLTGIKFHVVSINSNLRDDWLYMRVMLQLVGIVETVTWKIHASFS